MWFDLISQKKIKSNNKSPAAVWDNQATFHLAYIGPDNLKVKSC